MVMVFVIAARNLRHEQHNNHKANQPTNLTLKNPFYIDDLLIQNFLPNNFFSLNLPLLFKRHHTDRN